MNLLKLNDLIKVKIVSRPSKICKTPYVADVELKDGSIVQAHCASLGCCGLCEKDCYVYASPMLSNCPQSKSKVCSYKVYLAQIYEEKTINTEKYINQQLIGIDPKLAETLVEKALTSNCFRKISVVKCLKGPPKAIPELLTKPINLSLSDKSFLTKSEAFLIALSSLTSKTSGLK